MTIKLTETQFREISNSLNDLGYYYDVDYDMVKGVLDDDVEVIKVFEEGTYVHVTLNNGSNQYCQIHHINKSTNHYELVRINSGATLLGPLGHKGIREATTEEVKWLERGRVPFVFKEGDVVKGKFSGSIMCISTDDEELDRLDNAVDVICFVEDRLDK